MPCNVMCQVCIHPHVRLSYNLLCLPLPQIGMLVLSYVCEAMGEQLKPYFANMFPMFTAALQDTRSPTVPLYTIQYAHH